MDPEMRKWHHGQVKTYATMRSNCKDLAKTIEAYLEQLCASVAPFSIIQSRAKTVPSFAEKIIRKHHKYKDPVNQLTDLCGARVITYTQAEAEAVCRLIENDPAFEIDRENSLDVGSRLQTGEFGYRAMHYIVTVPGRKLGGRDVDPVQRKLKAEIQVSTMLQHVWAAIGHDRVYKTELKVPEHLKRDLSATMAFLENADDEFDRTSDALDVYAREFDAYMDEKEIGNQIDKWEAVLEWDESNEGAALRIAHLDLALDRAGHAHKTLLPFRPSRNPDVHRTLGCAARRRGRIPQARVHHLRAVKLDPGCVPAWCDLGDTYIATSARQAHDHYARAFALRPEEPRVLGPYLECRIRLERSARFLDMMRGSLNAAVEECEHRAAMGVYLPAAQFNTGRFLLFLGRPYEALDAYAKGIHLCTSVACLQEERDALGRIGKAIGNERLQGLDWAERFLRLAAITRHPDLPGGPARTRLRRELRSIATPGKNGVKLEKPVVIVAGGCAPAISSKIRRYRSLLRDTFRGFEGTLVSGGTTAGISGLVGDLADPDGAIHKVGYLPRKAHRPPEDEQHPAYRCAFVPGMRYSDRHPDEDYYNPLGPLQTWADLLHAEHEPDHVRILAVNGGRLTAFECQLALAMGATVGILEKTGRAASQLLVDAYWQKAKGFTPLPQDWATLAAFVTCGIPPEPDKLLMKAARAIHENFVDSNQSNPSKIDPSMFPWEDLDAKYIASNLHQAHYARHILRLAGYDVVKARGPEPKVLRLPARTVRLVVDSARREHGRYNAERLASGWRLAKVNNLERKENSSLVSWEDLPPRIREFDFEAVENWPKILATVGLEVVRRK